MPHGNNISCRVNFVHFVSDGGGVEWRNIRVLHKLWLRVKYVRVPAFSGIVL